MLLMSLRQPPSTSLRSLVSLSSTFYSTIPTNCCCLHFSVLICSNPHRIPSQLCKNHLNVQTLLLCICSLAWSRILGLFSLKFFEGMELEQPILGNHAISMTFDEVYMERSMGFVKALQELKSLRPQLYSASEYCEKTYLQNEQKQMVLDNIKDYAVRSLVNAVDHLGTAAYKLTELIEQQSIEVSNVELKVSWLNQQLLTCQTYKDKEGLRQQQLLGVIPRHHKHYILPIYVNKRVHFSPHIQTDLRQHHYEARSPTGNVASKTLSWHLASEAKPTLKGAAVPAGTASVNENENVPLKAAGVFHLVASAAAHGPQSSGLPSSRARRQSDPFDSSNKQWTGFDNAKRGEGVRIPVRSKSVLSAFFVKQKTPKLRLGSVM